MKKEMTSKILIGLGIFLSFYFAAVGYRSYSFGFEATALLWPLEPGHWVKWVFYIAGLLPIVIGVLIQRKKLLPTCAIIVTFSLCAVALSEVWYGVQDASIYLEAKKDPDATVTRKRYWPAPFGEEVVYSIGEGGYVTD